MYMEGRESIFVVEMIKKAFNIGGSAVKIHV